MKLRNKKTGEIVEVESSRSTIGSIGLYYEGKDGWVGTDFFSLAELNEEWEDYTHTEPLIKDEKIRKAVRAWAEVNSIKEVQYCERANRSLCILTDMGDKDFSIEFVGWMPTLKDGEVYTIAELCGEEEE